jgi:hypothetical protein
MASLLGPNVKLKHVVSGELDRMPKTIVYTYMPMSQMLKYRGRVKILNPSVIFFIFKPILYVNLSVSILSLYIHVYSKLLL